MKKNWEKLDETKWTTNCLKGKWSQILFQIFLKQCNEKKQLIPAKTLPSNFDSDLAHPNSNLSNSHSPSHSIQGILLLQTNTPALLLHLPCPGLLWSSSIHNIIQNFLIHYNYACTLKLNVENCWFRFYEGGQRLKNLTEEPNSKF